MLASSSSVERELATRSRLLRLSVWFPVGGLAREMKRDEQPGKGHYQRAEMTGERHRNEESRKDRRKLECSLLDGPLHYKWGPETSVLTFST